MRKIKEISVIVPIYNIENYLKKCLQTLMNQSFGSYEVILVDDGSTDGSKKIAESYSEEYSEIFTLVCQENRGLSEASNTGMKFAKGKYLCFVDSDDYVETDYLQKLHECAESTEADLVFCAFRSVDEKGNVIKNIEEAGFEPGKGYTIEERKDLLLTQNAAWNKLYKRDIIESNHLQFTPGAWYEDLRFVKKYMLFASVFAYCDSILYNYLIRQGSIMNSMSSKRNIEIVDAIDEVKHFYEERNLLCDFYDEIEFLAIEHIYISTLVRLIRSNDKEQFKQVKKEFITRFPNFKRNKYIRGLERNRKIIFGMLNVRTYKLINILFGIKGKKHG